MQIPREEQALPETLSGLQEVSPHVSKQDQALAIFNHAAEEIRFFKEQQWRVTNYALVIYAALAATPVWVEPDSWRSWASLGAFVLVCITGTVAWRVLANLERSLSKERERLYDARDHLPLLRAIHKRHTLRDRSWMRGRRRFFPRRVDEQDTDGGPSVALVFAVALIGGLSVAALIILSRVPWQRVLACISQSAVSGSWPTS